jgi:alpha-beta hydrolase superfamily lysophospholipase
MTVASAVWTPDAILPGFEAKTLTFPDDYEGEVVATLVRRRVGSGSRRAVLSIHGFVDYFFHAHVAEQFVRRGYNFYALDLRKYGRSLRPHQRRYFCKSLAEYHADISAAIREIADVDGNASVLVHAHSTGGLIAAGYADDGDLRERIGALWLNSPFFDFAAPPLTRLALLAMGRLGVVAPFVPLYGVLPPHYGRSTHRSERGDWDYDLRLKPIDGFPIYLGWVRAIRAAQSRVYRGLSIACPVLVMHAAKSVDGMRWTEEILHADGVLDIGHMKRRSGALGRSVTMAAIDGGIHDLTLSKPAVREQVFASLFRWADAVT